MIETKDSRRGTETRDGINWTTIYIATWAEFAARDVSVFSSRSFQDGDLPVVGSKWPTNSALVCTQIEFEPYANKDDYVKIVATWSTNGSYQRRARANQVTSWEEEFSFSLSAQTVERYLDYDTGQMMDWPTAWTTAGNTAATDPGLTLFDTSGGPTFEWTLFGDALYISKLLVACGAINNSSFFNEYVLKRQQVLRSDYLVDIAEGVNAGIYDDTKKWLLYSYRITMHSAGIWQYSLGLAYNHLGWHKWVGPGTHIETPVSTTPVTTNAYPTYEFSNLWQGMDKYDNLDIFQRS